jgi:UDPglucose 6-dehydrogenase
MRIISTKYMTAGMGDAGPCHPRDNIALRWLAENLDLGYDIFDTVMHAREKQAENLAVYLTDLADEHNLPVVIHGKAYKPDVDMLDGSYSLLIGHYLTDLGVEFSYSDPLTGDTVADGQDAVVLLAHNRQITYGYTGELPEQQLYFTPGSQSIILDPWRKFNSTNYKVIHYGNTRGQV